jgi:hypothetical protein
VKPAVLKRLGQLEERHAAMVNARRPAPRRSFMDWFIGTFMPKYNIVQGRNESKFDVLARCVGMGSWELRQLLMNPPEFKSVVNDGLERFLLSRETE